MERVTCPEVRAGVGRAPVEPCETGVGSLEALKYPVECRKSGRTSRNVQVCRAPVGPSTAPTNAVTSSVAAVSDGRVRYGLGASRSIHHSGARNAAASSGVDDSRSGSRTSAAGPSSARFPQPRASSSSRIIARNSGWRRNAASTSSPFAAVIGASARTFSRKVVLFIARSTASRKAVTAGLSRSGSSERTRSGQVSPRTTENPVALSIAAASVRPTRSASRAATILRSS